MSQDLSKTNKHKILLISCITISNTIQLMSNKTDLEPVILVASIYNDIWIILENIKQNFQGGNDYVLLKISKKTKWTAKFLSK